MASACVNPVISGMIKPLAVIFSVVIMKLPMIMLTVFANKDMLDSKVNAENAPSMPF